jgi:hypothetical protein
MGVWGRRAECKGFDLDCYRVTGQKCTQPSLSAGQRQVRVYVVIVKALFRGIIRVRAQKKKDDTLFKSRISGGQIS